MLTSTSAICTPPFEGWFINETFENGDESPTPDMALMLCLPARWLLTVPLFMFRFKSGLGTEDAFENLAPGLRPTVTSELPLMTASRRMFWVLVENIMGAFLTTGLNSSSRLLCLLAAATEVANLSQTLLLFWGPNLR